jgi:DNA-nicking Smr family endonuclease
VSAKKKSKPDPHSPFSALQHVKEKLSKEEELRATGPAAAGAKKRPPAPHEARPEALKAQEEDERLAFHRLMSGVTPMTQTKGRVSKSVQTPASTELVPRARGAEAAKALAQEEEEVHARLRALVEGRERFEVADDGQRVEGRRIDIPKEVLRRLRHGTFPVDARVDLHGLSAGDARERVDAFLRETRVAGERCVLIIHGKGEHSPRGRGVLRGEIGAWLSQGSASEHVGAFATASEGDGGEGAVYVLLRR